MLPADFWCLAGPEPDLDDLMHDPLVQAMMKGDHVAPEELRLHCREIRHRLANRKDAA